MDIYCEGLDPSNALAFKKIVLQCYMIALQGYLGENSRLRENIDLVVNGKKDTLLTSFEEIKKSYKAEIDYIKRTFSPASFMGLSFVGGCYDALYKAYLEKNPAFQANVYSEKDNAAFQEKSIKDNEDNLTDDQFYKINYSPDHEHNENNFFDNAKNKLIVSCTDYINNRVLFKNSNHTVAIAVIKELGYLDGYSKRLEPIHAIAFKKAALQCYMIALLEYLPENSRLLESIKNFFYDQRYKLTNCGEVKQSYREQIELIKGLFSSVNSFMPKGGGSFTGCCDALYCLLQKAS